MIPVRQLVEEHGVVTHVTIFDVWENLMPKSRMQSFVFFDFIRAKPDDGSVAFHDFCSGALQAFASRYFTV
jgi:hypothetical protein